MVTKDQFVFIYMYSNITLYESVFLSQIILCNKYKELIKTVHRYPQKGMISADM